MEIQRKQKMAQQVEPSGRSCQVVSPILWAGLLWQGASLLREWPLSLAIIQKRACQGQQRQLEQVSRTARGYPASFLGVALEGQQCICVLVWCESESTLFKLFSGECVPIPRAYFSYRSWHLILATQINLFRRLTGLARLCRGMVTLKRAWR